MTKADKFQGSQGARVGSETDRLVKSQRVMAAMLLCLSLVGCDPDPTDGMEIAHSCPHSIAVVYRNPKDGRFYVWNVGRFRPLAANVRPEDYC